MSDEPVVSHKWPAPVPVDGIAPGECVDSAYILTDHAGCDVCLMVDQFPDMGNGRHALMRMDASEARRLGAALMAASELEADRGRTIRHPENPNFCGCLNSCMLTRTECRRNDVRCRYRHESVKPLSHFVVIRPPGDQQESGG